MVQSLRSPAPHVSSTTFRKGGTVARPRNRHQRQHVRSCTLQGDLPDIPPPPGPKPGNWLSIARSRSRPWKSRSHSRQATRLTRDVAALQKLPHYDSSAMDGWAINGGGPWILADRGPFLCPGRASVIATGGLVPAGAQSILRKESGQIHHATDGSLLLRLNDNAKEGEPAPGQHIRPAGEEAAAGEVLIPAGTTLNPGHIALAAVAGHDNLQVQAKPVVGIVLTGSEVVTSGVPEPGHVRDTFGPQLGTVISLLGGTPAGSLRIGDSYPEWLAALGGSEAFPGRTPDVTITTGGTGCSGTDHFRAAISCPRRTAAAGRHRHAAGPPCCPGRAPGRPLRRRAARQPPGSNDGPHHHGCTAAGGTRRQAPERRWTGDLRGRR